MINYIKYQPIYVMIFNSNDINTKDFQRKDIALVYICVT